MRISLIVFFLLFSLGGFCQKKQKPGNYLRRETQEPETWFTLAGKKNGKKIKTADLSKAEGIKTGDKFDGIDILGMDVVIKKKGLPEEKTSLPDLKFNSDMQTRFSKLLPGDKIIIYVRTKNRSTQVENFVRPHVYYIAK